TTVPGWHGAGTVAVDRLNLARWMNRPDRPSDITGRVTFDLALELGRHFPRGMYTFNGPHAMYLDYAADNVRARGTITATEVRVDRADRHVAEAAALHGGRRCRPAVNAPLRRGARRRLAEGSTLWRNRSRSFSRRRIRQRCRDARPDGRRSAAPRGNVSRHALGRE